jgi:putative thioredoxin
MDLIFNSKAKSQGGDAVGVDKDLIKEGTTASFMADVMEMSLKVPVIAEFRAPATGQGKAQSALLEKLVREAKGAVRLVTVDVHKYPDLAAQLRVEITPTTYAFKNGRPVDGFAGAQSDSQMREFVKRLTGGAGGPTLDDYVTEAKQILAEGDAQAAAGIFQQVLSQDPDNAGAMAGLLRCLIALGDNAQAEAILAQLPPELARHSEIAAVKTALELARNAGEVGEAAELRRKLDANADDHQARYDLALAYYANSEAEAAVDELLELFRRDRSWNEDAARKQLVKMFEVLGFAHPLAKSGRSRLSTMLFA